MVTGSPLMRIWPESAGWAPDSVCIRVDLPAPLPADEGDHLTRVEVHADTVDGVEAAEGHADVPHLHEGHGPPLRRWRCGGRVGHGAASCAAGTRCTSEHG